MVEPGKDERCLPDLSKTLQELDGCDWGEPVFLSYVVTTCHSARRKPLGELTVEELRLAIGQQVGLPYLIPLAIERLKANPLIETTFFEGDLFKNVFSVPRDFWDERPDWRSDLEGIAKAFFRRAADMDDQWRVNILPGIAKEYEQFIGLQPPTRWLRANQGAEPPSPNWMP